MLIDDDLPADGGEEDVMPTVASDDEIERWTAELVTIDAEMARLSERKMLLQKVLNVLPDIEKLRGRNPETVNPASNDSAPITLTDAIPMVLRKAGQPMAPAEIKRALKDIGYAGEHGNNYFYTAIKRSTEKNRIVRTADNKYIAAPNGGEIYPRSSSGGV